MCDTAYWKKPPWQYSPKWSNAKLGATWPLVQPANWTRDFRKSTYQVKESAYVISLSLGMLSVNLLQVVKRTITPLIP